MLLLSLFAMVLQCIQNKIQSPLTGLQKALYTLTLSHHSHHLPLPLSTLCSRHRALLVAASMSSSYPPQGLVTWSFFSPIFMWLPSNLQISTLISPPRGLP